MRVVDWRSFESASRRVVAEVVATSTTCSEGREAARGVRLARWGRVSSSSSARRRALPQALTDEVHVILLEPKGTRTPAMSATSGRSPLRFYIDQLARLLGGTFASPKGRLRGLAGLSRGAGRARQVKPMPRAAGCRHRTPCGTHRRCRLPPSTRPGGLGSSRRRPTPRSRSATWRFSTSTSISAALCFTPWYEPIGLPNAMRIFAYSVVMSRTFWAPRTSRRRAHHRRSTTRARGAQPSPSGRAARRGHADVAQLHSQSLRVWSIVAGA